ncbi:hypothetical protein HDU91_006719 [Kappamyces sp. JEL0680]|nr:hypothetical protein HDU91_006719 [Kappamyces sp. JEL0680]
MFIEVLPQLSLLSVSIPVRDKLTIEVQSAVLKINSDAIAMPENVALKANASRISKDKNWIVLQVPITKTEGLDGETPGSGGEWPNQFACLTCNAVVGGPMHVKKTLDLPSDFWYEMTDCWACHHEDYTTLSGQEGGTIYAQKDFLLNGLGYYLVHPHNMALDRLRLRFTGRESPFKSNRWIEVCCKRCHNPVGEGFMDRNAADGSMDIGDITSFKLHKYRIHSDVTPVSGSGDSVRLPYYPFSHYFLRTLIETANAHANYRSILVDEYTLAPCMVLWVLNWNSEIGVQAIAKERLVLRPAIKILYRRIQMENGEDQE